MTVAIDPGVFRTILGHFATGIVLVTAGIEGKSYGMSVNSFTSVSLDPPLVGFFPARTSETWPSIRRAGAFAVTILREGQEEVSRRFAIRGIDRFDGFRWAATPSGHPVLADALAWIDCRIDSTAPAGDHEMVLGRVLALSEAADGRPLLFFRGRYAHLAS